MTDVKFWKKKIALYAPSPPFFQALVTWRLPAPAAGPPAGRVPTPEEPGSSSRALATEALSVDDSDEMEDRGGAGVREGCAAPRRRHPEQRSHWHPNHKKSFFLPVR
jgi:hypothetical protein